MLLVIAIPIYKVTLDHFEEIALIQLTKVIGNKYPVIFFGPEGLDVSYYKKIAGSVLDFSFRFFNRIYFRDLITYSDLCINPEFYRTFLGFEFLLIYQVDAFLFTDDLEHWCRQDFDYIGAPFFEHNLPLNKTNYFGVGNGGFSLRKVDSMLRILTTHNKIYSREDINSLKEGKNFKGRLFYELIYKFGFLGLLNTTHYRFTNYKGYEDFFWGYYAGPKLDWMKFPAYEEALKFSFEYSCEKLFADNNYELPTGCHGWLKVDNSFWKPHFLDLGIEI